MDIGSKNTHSRETKLEFYCSRRKKLKGLSFLIFFLGAFPSLTFPAESVKRYNYFMENYRVIEEAYVDGLGSGLSWLNSSLMAEGKQFYCPPDNLALNSKNYISMIERGINNFNLAKSNPEAVYIEFILIQELKNTFPCSKE